MAECEYPCLSAADIGVPEAGDVIAYAHPDCPEHGYPQEEYPELYVCIPGYDETQPYVREEDIGHG